MAVRVVGRHALSGEAWLDRTSCPPVAFSKLLEEASVAAASPISDFVLLLGDPAVRLDGLDGGDKWKLATEAAAVVEVSLLRLVPELLANDDDAEAAAMVEHVDDVGPLDALASWPAAGRSWSCCLHVLECIMSLAEIWHGSAGEDDTVELLRSAFAPYASASLLRSPAFLLAATRLGCWQVLEFAKVAVGRDVLLLAVGEDWRALRYADDELRRDAELARLALDQSGEALEFVGDAFSEDKAVVMEAVGRSGPAALRFASAELRRDPNVLAACAACAACAASEEEELQLPRNDGLPEGLLREALQARSLEPAAHFSSSAASRT